MISTSPNIRPVQLRNGSFVNVLALANPYHDHANGEFTTGPSSATMVQSTRQAAKHATNEQIWRDMNAAWDDGRHIPIPGGTVAPEARHRMKLAGGIIFLKTNNRWEAVGWNDSEGKPAGELATIANLVAGASKDSVHSSHTPARQHVAVRRAALAMAADPLGDSAQWEMVNAASDRARQKYLAANPGLSAEKRNSLEKGHGVYRGSCGHVDHQCRCLGCGLAFNMDIPCGECRKPLAMSGDVHEFSSTQINLPSEHAAKVLEMAHTIDDKDLADDGRETVPHVTVKYGLHSADSKEVARAVRGESRVRFTIGKASVFPANERRQSDVIKLDVDSPDLHRLNGILSKLPNTTTYKGYTPHITVAHVKPGLGEKYAKKMNSMAGTKVEAGRIRFSSKNGMVNDVPLSVLSLSSNLFGHESNDGEQGKLFEGGRAGRWITIHGGQHIFIRTDKPSNRDPDFVSAPGSRNYETVLKTEKGTVNIHTDKVRDGHYVHTVTAAGGGAFKTLHHSRVTDASKDDAERKHAGLTRHYVDVLTKKGHGVTIKHFGETGSIPMISSGIIPPTTTQIQGPSDPQERRGKQSIYDVMDKVNAQNAAAAKPAAKSPEEPSSMNRIANVKRTYNDNQIQFDPPIVGSNGAKILGYEWKHHLEDTPDHAKQVKKSDWSQAATNEHTGMQIVHQFMLDHGDGSEAKIVSMETAIRALGYDIPEGRNAFKAMGEDLMRVADLKRQLKSASTVSDNPFDDSSPASRLNDQIGVVMKRIEESRKKLQALKFTTSKPALAMSAHTAQCRKCGSSNIERGPNIGGGRSLDKCNDCGAVATHKPGSVVSEFDEDGFHRDQQLPWEIENRKAS